jgi:hypothetical protein
MGDKDKELFHQYIYGRNGYFTLEYIKKSVLLKLEVPIADAKNPIEFDDRTIKLFSEANFPKENFQNKEWLSFSDVRNSYFVHGPGMQYTQSYTDKNGIHRGRLYMGLVTSASYLKPSENIAAHFRPKYKGKFSEIENFYRSCCRYIRKNYRKDKTGFYYGPQSDKLIQSGIKEIQW